MTLKRVVVTGLGALTPIGNTLPEYWNNLKSGKSGAAPITRFDAKLYKTKFACEVKDFDIGNFMDRKEARKMDPFAQFLITLLRHCRGEKLVSKSALNTSHIIILASLLFIAFGTCFACCFFIRP